MAGFSHVVLILVPPKNFFLQFCVVFSFCFLQMRVYFKVNLNRSMLLFVDFELRKNQNGLSLQFYFR